MHTQDCSSVEFVTSTGTHTVWAEYDDKRCEWHFTGFGQNAWLYPVLDGPSIDDSALIDEARISGESTIWQGEIRINGSNILLTIGQGAAGWLTADVVISSIVRELEKFAVLDDLVGALHGGAND